MRGRGKADDQDLAAIIESLLDEGETLLWWDKFSDRSIIGGFGKTLTLFTLAVNGFILALIFLPPLLPVADELSWLLLPLLLVDAICLLFIMLYFAFGLMTGGVNAITTRRALVADVHRKRIVGFMQLDTLSAIRLRRRKNDRGDILFLRERDGREPASADAPRRLTMLGLRHFAQVVDLLRERSNLLEDEYSTGGR